MQYGFCSYSFHRRLAAGQQDVFQLIKDCKALGCATVDPWNAHLSALQSGDQAIHAGHNPSESGHLTAVEDTYIDQVRSVADAAGMPFGLVAVDGAHIYDPDPDRRAANRARAYRWIEVSARLGAKQMRVDAGGSEELTPDELAVISEGYADIIARANPYGIEILIENHWGPSIIPANIPRLLDACPGLGFLCDTHNWKPELKSEGRRHCSKYATATHIKPLAFDADGNETGDNALEGLQELVKAGYKGIWGLESTSRDDSIDELDFARRAVEFLKRHVPA